MKFWVLAAAISLGLAQQGKPPNTAGAAKSNAPHVTNPATSGQKTDPSSAAAASAAPGNANGATASQSANNLNREDSEIQIKLTWFAAALAVVAALQLLTLIWQGFAIRKMLGGITSQSQEIDHQSSVMDRQLKIMEEQLSALKDTASAASSSAAAAKESVDLIASKERARLRIELHPFYLNFDAPSAASFTIQHQGSTDAFVLNSRAAIYVSHSKDPDPMVGKGKPLPIPSIISAKDPVVVAQDVLHPFTEEEIESIRQLKSFVHFMGFVRYKDVFDGEHETRFNRVWSIAKMNNIGQEPFTYWEHCGGADANIET